MHDWTVIAKLTETKSHQAQRQPGLDKKTAWCEHREHPLDSSPCLSVPRTLGDFGSSCTVAAGSVCKLLLKNVIGPRECLEHPSREELALPLYLDLIHFLTGNEKDEQRTVVFKSRRQSESGSRFQL